MRTLNHRNVQIVRRGNDRVGWNVTRRGDCRVVICMVKKRTGRLALEGQLLLSRQETVSRIIRVYK